MLASRAISKYEELQHLSEKPRRLIIALAGPPGSGKTTIAQRVAALIGAQQASTSSPKVVVVSMDGFHLSRAVLDKLPNREEAYVRRGAPWTFDANGVVTLVRRCKGGINETILAPSFDHAVKDPVADGVIVPAGTEIIIFEGLYLLLDSEPWQQIGAMADERWFVQVDPEVAKERVAVRHVAAGIEPDLESGRRRVEANDELNGRFINEHSKVRDVVIQSVSE
jgi:pantothenate kinase